VTPNKNRAQGFRLASYNIHGALGRDGRRDLGRVVRVLEELDADLVALQEVDSRHGEFDMLDELAARTGLTPIAGPTLIHHRGSYGNAVLTRASILAVRRIDLSVQGREPRGAIDVDIRLPDGALRVLATHLGLRPAERRHQVQRLLAALKESERPATVMMGDLNEWFFWSQPSRRLHTYFMQTAAPPTFPARFPLLALDRIWARPKRMLRELRAHTSPLARVASDHLPVTAVFAP